MKNLKHMIKLMFGCMACTAIVSMAGAGTVRAEESTPPLSEPVFIYGTIQKEEDGRLSMTNIHGEAVVDELILNISDETRILDAENGFPVSFENLKDGENVYAYISHAMTMSLPAQSHAEMIICQVPENYAAPIFETASNLSVSTNSAAVLNTVRGNTYQIDTSTVLLPFLTRNIVTINDLTQGRTFLVWRRQTASGISQTASKIVVFPSLGSAATGPASEIGFPKSK